MHPEYVFAVKDEAEALPNHETYGYCFMSKDEYTLLPVLPYNQILIETKLTKPELNLYISKQHYNQTAVLLMQNDLISVNQFNNEISQMKSVQTIFPVIFLLVAILTILTTMTRITVNQRMQIGILKALGFSNRRILLHYSAFGFMLSLFGSILGSLLGIFMLPNVVYQFQKSFYILPNWYRYSEPYVFITVGFCVLCCGFCGFYACKKQLEDVAAKILRPKVEKQAKLTSIEKSSWWSKLSFDVAWNLRDCMHNKLRSFITVFGIVGCMTLLLCALGMNDTMNYVMNTSYNELNTYESKVTLSTSITSDILNDLQSNPNNQFLQETAVEVQTSTSLETVSMQIVSHGDYLKYQGKSGDLISLPDNGVLISNNIAKNLSVEVGDTLLFRLYGNKAFIEANIVAITKNPIGQGIFLSSTYYEILGQTFTPTSFVTNQTNLILEEGFATIQTKEAMIHSMDEILSMMYVMIFIMIIAAATLGIVVLYNLGVLSFYEKVRELATLKVLGFQYRRLSNLLQKQNIWLTLIGLILGMPSGYLVLNFMVQFMGDNFDFAPSVSIFSYTSSCIGVLALSLGVNRFMSRKLKSIDMVSALKSTE
jgi:putative ABC transport system permease protein